MPSKEEIAGKYKHFGCKVLLVGEYLVLNGHSSLAMPFDRFGGGLVFDRGKQKEFDWMLFIAYLKKEEIKLDYVLLEQDLKNGLVFRSDIPIGYGLGSSGTLVAALYDAYIQSRVENVNELKLLLARMESFFHGKSSGIDPLVILLHDAVLIKNNVLSKQTLHPQVFDSWYLFDSGISRSSTNFIEYYKSYIFPLKEKLVLKLSKLNHQLIDMLISNNNLTSDQADLWKEISKMQLILFKKMIPAHVYLLWKKGLETDDFYMKLCGAGGGGFFLIYKNKMLPTGTNFLKLL